MGGFANAEIRAEAGGWFLRHQNWEFFLMLQLTNPGHWLMFDYCKCCIKDLPRIIKWCLFIPFVNRTIGRLGVIEWPYRSDSIPNRLLGVEPSIWISLILNLFEYTYFIGLVRMLWVDHAWTETNARSFSPHDGINRCFKNSRVGKNRETLNIVDQTYKRGYLYNRLSLFD